MNTDNEVQKISRKIRTALQPLIDNLNQTGILSPIGREWGDEDVGWFFPPTGMLQRLQEFLERQQVKGRTTAQLSPSKHYERHQAMKDAASSWTDEEDEQRRITVWTSYECKSYKPVNFEAFYDMLFAIGRYDDGGNFITNDGKICGRDICWDCYEEEEAQRVIDILGEFGFPVSFGDSPTLMRAMAAYGGKKETVQ